MTACSYNQNSLVRVLLLRHTLAAFAIFVWVVLFLGPETDVFGKSQEVNCRPSDHAPYQPPPHIPAVEDRFSLCEGPVSSIGHTKKSRVGLYRLSRSLALRYVGTMTDVQNVNLDKPRWDQSTYLGRAQHFFTVTNPLNLLYTSAQLDHAKDIVERHRAGKPQEKPLTVDELWKAKHVYDSAFHPVTGEKVFILGRMSAQVPSNMIITGNMMLFYQTTPAVVFWQWVNQSFNALVNYCNRSDSSMPLSQIARSYAIATTGAVVTAVALNKMTAKMPPLVGRLVPFAAVAAANCVNIPAMRNKELAEGISVFDDNGNVYGRSKVAAREATISVVVSRIIMAAPGMAITPIVMNSLEKKGILRRSPYIGPTVVIGLTGVILTFATPLACALFAQTAPIDVSKLESEIKDAVNKQAPTVTSLYYNKGL